MTTTTTSYAITRDLDQPFDEVVARIREELVTEGFGVLTEIDVQATLREKLGKETGQYLILGACNPPLAHQALTADPSIGLLLPCNVVVRTEPGQTVVEALDPMTMVAVTGEPSLKPVAEEAARRLRAALAGLPRT
jgi:uncharacterized protein (DUF302 family)